MVGNYAQTNPEDIASKTSTKISIHSSLSLYVDYDKRFWLSNEFFNI
jgi:hypothetical protein